MVSLAADENIDSLIVYRGRAGDRNTRGTAGAQMLGALLARRYGLDTTFVSTPQAPLPSTAWNEQLAAARGDLHAFADALRAAFRDGHRSIVAMGRCAAGLATVPVIAERHPDACIVWFDAHGDSNLPSSNAVPYLGGMVLTGAAGHWDSGLGAGLRLSNVVLVGARDLDPHEKELIAQRPAQARGRRAPTSPRASPPRWAIARSTCTSTATCSSPASSASNTR